MTNDANRSLKDTDFSGVRNRNEPRVCAAIAEALAEMGHADMPEEMVKDIFAYALNQLPTLYPQREPSGPDDPVRAWSIHAVVENAIQHVKAHPKKR